MDAAWLDLGPKTRVIVYFVSALSTQYPQTVFVPLRVGTVVKTFIEGEYYFVDFKLGKYIDPSAFKPQNAQLPSEGIDFAARSLRSVASTESMKVLLGHRYPAGNFIEPTSPRVQYSAVLGPRPFSEGTGGDVSTMTRSFVEVAKVLDDLLGPSSLEGLIYFRVLGIRRAGKQKVQSALKGGAFTLVGGERYEMETFQFRETNTTGFEVRVVLPDVVNRITQQEVLVASKYDVTSFGFFTLPRDSTGSGEIMVKVESRKIKVESPNKDVDCIQQPVARFPIVVKPRWYFTGLSILIGVATAFAAFALALASLQGVVFVPPKPGQADVFGFTWPFIGYVRFLPAALLVASIAGIGSGVAAFGAVFRRRFGLNA